ncbi:hypothetical protein [Candidatus Tokpelaia sp.]|uniref:hypothetical protein n=1 Tax=Candidatus Tokpelaia sp. TaxID=2233777 RepID=UPI001680DD93|nr:hypothetical protein [Candidatus Tokpelaia sp.]
MTAENGVRPSENDENGLSDMQAVYLCCLAGPPFPVIMCRWPIKPLRFGGFMLYAGR